MRVGIIGAGGMGREHAINLAALSGVEVVAIADPRPDVARRLAAEVGAEVVPTGSDLIGRGGVDAIVVASPDTTHARFVTACIERGLPVFCEKPLAHTLAEAGTVRDAESAAGRRLVQVGFMRPFDPAHMALREAITDLGDIHHLRLVHRNASAPCRSVEQIMVQSLVHDFHSVRWLTGHEVVSVSTHSVGPPTALRFVRVAMELESGSLATAEFEDGAYGYEVGVEVNAARGTATIGLPQAPLVRADGEARRHVGNDWFGRFRHAYRSEMRAWVSAVGDGSMVAGADVADGVAAQEIAEAAIRAHTAGAPLRLAAP